MYSKETYFKVKEQVVNSELTIPQFFKKIHKNQASLYRSKKLFDGDYETKQIFK